MIERNYIIEKSLSISHDIFPKIYDPQIKATWHFAFAFKRNKLLAIGQNNPNKSDSFKLRIAKRSKVHNVKYPYIHAESDLIGRLWGKTYIDSKIQIVVIRLNVHGMLCASKPCRECMGIIQALGIDKVYWSTRQGDFGSLKKTT